MRELGITQGQVLESYRPRLVRLCTRLTGNSDWAEELAQETLIEAWRNWHKLERGEVSFAWLAQIARFVVRRGWRRKERLGRREHYLSEAETESLVSPEPDHLEQEEILVLLDRALGKLPERTRSLLQQTYVEGKSVQEIADRNAITPANVSVRLWRGRAALQSVIQTHFQEEALAYGLVSAHAATWRETPVWCGNCGQRRLLVHRGENQIVFRCPQCHPDTDVNAGLVFLRNTLPPGPLPGHRVLIRRLSKQIADFYLPALEAGGTVCEHCGSPLALQHYTPLSRYPTLRDRYGIYGMCNGCEKMSFGATLGRLYMAHPEVQRFWSQNPRMARSTEEDIHYQGVEAVRIPFTSKLSNARLSVIVRRDTFQLLGVE